MSRSGFLIALILLAGPAAAQDVQSYSPSKPATAPKLINAEVTKADAQTGLVTFRSESGDVLVTAGREVTAGMALKPGDKVMIAFRDVKDASGFPSRVVTEVRLASPAAGAPAARASVPASAPKKRKAGRVQASGAPATATTGAARGTAQGQASTTGSTQAGNAGSAQGGGAAPGSGTPAAGAAVTTTGGGVVTTGGGTRSPYTNPVPSVNGPAPVVTAVLPPAGAKAPLTEAEIGTMRAKAPLTEAEIGTMRAQGLRDLDASAVVLAAVANDIDAAWFRFKSQCLKSATAETSASSGREWFAITDVPSPADDNDTCRTMRTELTARVKGFQDQLAIVEDAARKADLLPAQVREVLDRHRLIR